MSANDVRPIGISNTYVQKERRSIPWIWEGVVAEKAVTLLSAPEKIGKTTLLSLLLDRRRAGGELLGRTVYPGKTLLCSEEDKCLWALRQPPLDFGPDLTFHQPWGECPTRGRWKRFIDDLIRLSFHDDGPGLVVIDTAARFLPLGDRNKRTLRWSLSQLGLVSQLPAGVLVLNQSRHVHRPLAAFADIVIEMAIPRGPGMTRRRTFSGIGRYPDTLQTVTAELNPEATDYVLQDASPSPHAPLLATLQALLKESPTSLTRQELVARWPGAAPRQDTLWRTLARGIELGIFTVTGAGTKAEALRYGVVRKAKAMEVAAGTETPGVVRGAVAQPAGPS